MIAENDPEEEAISRKMCGLYDLRSAIIHGGNKKSSFDDVRISFRYIQKAIDRGLSQRELRKEKDTSKKQ